MKEVKHYICEICGTEYNDKRKCQDCEEGHKKPMKIVGEKYQPITANHLGIPTRIEVEMEDGRTYIYTYGK